MSSTSIVTNITVQFIRYASIPVLIFGSIGNIFNILIFTRPLLIKSPCSTYLLCLSIVNLLELFFGLVARFLSDGFGIDIISSNEVYCRIRYYIVDSSMVLSSWFIILAGIDRYCISSRDALRRRLSNLKYARYLVALTTLVVLVLYSHALVLFTIQQLPTGPYCYARDGAYRIFYDSFYFASYSFIPPILMIIIGLGTFYNIHQIHVQVVPTIGNNINVYQLRKRDRQMIKMLLIQFMFTVALTLPIAIQKLYATFTQNAVKDALQLAIENLFAEVTRILAFINCSTSFYIFTLSGSLYRKELVQIITKMIGFIFGKNSLLYRKFQELNGQQLNTQAIVMNQVVTIVS